MAHKVNKDVTNRNLQNACKRRMKPDEKPYAAPEFLIDHPCIISLAKKVPTPLRDLAAACVSTTCFSSVTK